MEFFRHNTKIDFMGLRKWTAILSVVLFIASLSSLAVYHLKWGLDFTGGTQIQVSYSKPANLEKIRTELAKAGFSKAVVQSYGTSEDVAISIAPRANQDQQKLVAQVMKVLPGAQNKGVDFVGPQVGKELATKGALAVLVALLSTMIYIAMRFEYRFAVSSAAALIHDPLLILGIFSFFHIDFDLNADNLFTTADRINYNSNDVTVSGKKSSVGIIPTPGVISTQKQEYKYIPGTSGKIESFSENPEPVAIGRKSWRQIQ